MIHPIHCQGVCGDEAGSAVVCGPTQVKNKKVKMMFKVYNVVYSSFIIFFSRLDQVISTHHHGNKHQ